MASFGIVSEGITDHHVIKSILIGWCSTDDGEPVINQLHPPGDASSTSQPAPGGWTLVFDYLRSGRYEQAMEQNDFVVLQVDTDVCEQPGFDVPRRGLTLPDLVTCVASRLENLIDREFYAQYGRRFIFAIAVDEIECWLLPLLHETSEPVKAAKTTGCLEAVSHKLRLLNRSPLQKGERKDHRAYQRECRDYRKRAALMKHGPRNPSLAIFLDELTRKTAVSP